MILVTGGAGFIGSVLVHHLNEQGKNQIVVVDRLGTGEKWLNLRGLKFDSFIHADELFEHHRHIFEQVKAIYHLGACSDTTEKDVDFLWKNNVLFSQKLFTVAAQKEIKFLYASSAATYGDGGLGYNDHHETIEKLRPLNPYGYSKQLFDEWVLRQKRFPPRWFGIKFFNVYGPHEAHKGKMVSVVYQAYKQVMERGVIRLFKSHREGFDHGGQIRDFVYVKDVVKAMTQMMDLDLRGSGSSPAAISGIYNMGTGQGRTFNDLAKAVLQALGREEGIEYFDMPLELQKQYQYFTQANMDKFFGVLPQFQFSDLETGVRDYVLKHLHTDDPFLNIR